MIFFVWFGRAHMLVKSVWQMMSHLPPVQHWAHTLFTTWYDLARFTPRWHILTLTEIHIMQWNKSIGLCWGAALSIGVILSKISRKVNKKGEVRVSAAAFAANRSLMQPKINAGITAIILRNKTKLIFNNGRVRAPLDLMSFKTVKISFKMLV